MLRGVSVRANKYDEDDQGKLLRVLKYLHGTLTLGIKLVHPDTSTPLNIDVYADASFAIHTSDRRSQSGICIQIGSSNQANKVTTSSTEAELVACADAIPYAEGLRKLLLELNFPVGPVVITKTTSQPYA
jgi:hypothetical protein